MGLLNFFDKDPNEKIINQINEFILSTDSFIYFSKDNEKSFIDYKRFETLLLAAAIHKVILEKKVGRSLTDNDQQSIKKIYLKNTTHFYNTYIKSEKLKLSILSSNYINESRWIIKVFGKFNGYVKDVDNILKNKKTYWIEDWNVPEYDGEVGIELTGQKIYHSFINNIFLCDLVNDSEDIPYIKPIETWSIPEEDLEYIQKFVDKVHDLILNLSR